MFLNKYEEFNALLSIYTTFNLTYSEHVNYGVFVITRNDS